MLRPTDFYLFRSSAFSFDDLNDLNAAIDNKNITAVKKIYSNTYFLNALFFASKDFYHITKDWIDKDSEFNENDKILISLYKYYNRICVRSTPYGLFAGFARGKIVNEKSSIVQDKNSFEFYVRPDMSIIDRFIENINSAQNLSTIKFSTNNTVYYVADKIRYIEADFYKNYSITQVQSNDFLISLLKFAESGKYFNEIKDFIKNTLFDIDNNEINLFINDLISSQLIIKQTPPYITSNDDILTNLSKQFSSNQQLVDYLTKVKDISINIKNTLINNKLISNSLYYKNQYNFSDQDFQIDLKINFQKNQLNNKLIDTLSKTVNEIIKLPNAPHHLRINDFKIKFFERFGTEEILLVHALDPQIGIGYDLQVSGNIEEVPLINDINFSLPEQLKTNNHHKFIEYLQNKFQSNFNHVNLLPIQLEEDDIKNNISEDTSKRMFSDYYLMGQLSSKDINCLDKGEYKFNCTSSIPNPLMATVLSRFSYHDNILTEKIKDLINKESDNHTVVEIVHQPDGRIGNILLRPSFYNHEIAYYSLSNPENNQISINDLLISIVNNEIILRYKKTGKIIIPRLSSAHNFHKAQLPFYRFICDLQFYNKSNGVKWDWGHLKDSFYLPRVEYKNLILCEAKWQLFFYDGLNISLLKEKIKELTIPTFFKIKDNDNTLLLDSNNIVCLNILLKKLKEKRKLFVYELIEDSFFVKNGSKKYSSELIIPLINDEEIMSSNIIKKEENSLIKRKFLPGDEWTYFKIYCSHIVCDELVSSVLYNLQSIFLNKKFEWFFIRYDDPNHHLRLRIKSSDSNRLLKILHKELEFYIQNRLIFSICQDTYDREIERYGSNTIEDSEKLFYYDSVCTTKLLNLIQDNNEKEEIRYLIALLSVDRIFNDFGIDYLGRRKIIEEMFESFQSEFVETKNKDLKKDFKKSIDKKLRDHKLIINNILIEKKYEGIFIDIDNILKERTNSIVHIINQLSFKFSTKDQLESWLSSFIHMNLNRIFFTHARMHETIIYFLLYKTYITIQYRKSNG